MGVVKNVIQTLFTTRGADEVEGAANRVGRAQTRLTSTSTSAGRAFAAQASGMGGLVGAYAGAAATVIALSSAYSALTKAAQAKQTLEGLNALAAGSAVSGEKLLASVQKITKGQLALSEAAGNINLALSAGFSGKQIEGLSSVALKASRALGRDLTDSMTRVVRGSAKMEAELLDELGIYTKIGPATRAYAASLGVSVTSLTEFQRRQAFANAVIAEGQRKFASISTVVPTTSEQLQAFSATISNITTQVTMFIADGLAPLASFLTDNLGASFGSVGIAAALVFSKALSLLKAQITAFGAGVDAYATRLSDRILKAGALTTQKLGVARAAVAGISGNVKGTAGIGDDITALKKVAGERNLNTQELAKANAVLSKRIDNLKTLRTGEMAQVTALKTQRAALQANGQSYDAVQKSIDGVYKRIQISNKLLTSTRAELDAVTAASNTSAAGFARFSSGLVKGVGGMLTGIAKLSLGMVSLASKGLAIVSVVGIVGSAIANMLGKGDEFDALTIKLGKSIKGLFTSGTKAASKNVFQGTTAAILASMEAVDANLKSIDSFTFKEKFLGVSIDVEKTKQQIVSDVSTVMSDLEQGNKMDFSDAILTQRTGFSAAGGALAGAFVGSFVPVIGTGIGAAVGAIGGALLGAFSNVGNAKYEPSDTAKAAVQKNYQTQLAGFDEATQKQLSVALAYFQDQYGEIAKIDPVARQMLDTYSQLVIENGKYSHDVFVISDTMKTIGKDAATVTKNFDFKTGIEGIDYLSSAITKIGNDTITFKNFDIDTDALNSVLDTKFTDLKTISAMITPAMDTEAAKTDLDRFLRAVQSDIDNLSMQPGDAVATEINSNLYPAVTKAVDTIGGLKEVINTTDIGSAFRTAHGSISVAQGDMMRVAELLKETQQGVEDNSISFDQYTQNVTNSTAAMTSSTVALIKAKNDLSAAQEKANLAVGTPQEKAANQILKAEESRVAALEQSLATGRAILDTMKEQSAELQKHLDLQNYLVSITPKTVSNVELGAKVATAGSGNELQTQIQYSYAVVSANKEALTTYNDLSAKLKTMTLDTTQMQAALAATNAKDFAAAINSAAVSAKPLADGWVSLHDNVSGTTTEVQALTAETAKAGETGTIAMTALAGLMQTLAVDTAKFAHDKIVDYQKMVVDANESLRQLAEKQIIVKAKFEIDSQDLTDQLLMSIEQFKLKKLQMDVTLIEAKKDSKALKPAEAAKQVNSKEQEILAQQRVILDKQFQNDMAKSLRDDTLMQKQAENDKADIDSKTKLLTDQINRDTAFISSSAKLYDAFIKQQHDVSQGFIDGYVAASNGLLNGLVAALSSGAAAIGESIKTQGVSTGVVSSGGPINVAPLADVGTALSDISITAIAEAGLAKSAIEASAEAQKTAIDDATADSIVLSAQRRTQLQSDHANEVTLLEESGAIEAENAKKRVASAGAETKAIEKLTGRLADMKSSIQGSFESAFMGLNDLIISGNGSIREIIGGLFKSIEEEVFKQTIATPLSNIISSWLVGGIQKAFNNQDILRSPLSGIAGSAVGATKEALTKNTMGDAAVDSGSKMFENIGKRLGGAMDSASQAINGAANTGANLVQGAGQVLAGTTQTTTATVAAANTAGASTLMTSLGPILAVLAVIAVIASLFGGKKKKSSSVLDQADAAGIPHNAANEQTIVSGSIPKMASGGLRDSAPTMLEPGEFVIRKPMVNKIGTSALESLNATGTVPEQAAKGTDKSRMPKLDMLETFATSFAKIVTDSISICSDALEFAGDTLSGSIGSTTSAVEDANLESSKTLDNAIKISTARVSNSNDIGASKLFTSGKKLSIANNLSTSRVGDATDLVAKVIKASTLSLAKSSDIGASKLFTSGKKLSTANNISFNKLVKSSIVAAKSIKTASNAMAKSNIASATSVKDSSILTSDTLDNVGTTVADSAKLVGGTLRNSMQAATSSMAESNVEGASILDRATKSSTATIADSMNYVANAIQSSNLLTTPAGPTDYGMLEQKPISVVPDSFSMRTPVALAPASVSQNTAQAAPVINISNEGSPKTATASPPRFDGERYVIDVIMRDLANNGPIRKSLRGGAI